MMNQEDPITRRYLANFEAGLAELTPSEREEVLRDIRSHISEAVNAGKPLDQVLGALGSSEVLARAYSIELLLSRPAAFKTPPNRLLRLVGLVVFGSIPTVVAVIVLGVVGLVFVLTGLILFVAGQAALADALPWWLTMDSDPRLALVVGPALSILGAAFLAALWVYARVAAGVVRRVLPPRQA
ncbi:MAG: hypothetical protein K1Y01_17720 [Vicinamibacteria bacterium]|nr:hypothetical protein [Vicinamibacteria bacterium]